MYNARAFLVACALLALSPAQSSLAAVSTRDDGEIQRWLNQHANVTQSVEVPAARHRVVGDLDGDGREDIAVLYTLKPRNGRRGELRYLAGFKRLPAKTRDGRREPSSLSYQAHVLVSGPGAGEANRATILERSVVVEMLIFRPGDAACCPTLPIKRRYRLTARGFSLIRADAVKRAR